MRKQHLYEQHVGYMTVTVAFTVMGSDVISVEHVQQALALTSLEHPFLRCCLAKSDPVDPASPTNIVYLPESQAKFDDGVCVFFSEEEGVLQGAEDLTNFAVEKARRPAQNAVSLFVLYVRRFTDGYSFVFVFNHGFTDGTSVFHVVDAFARNLSAVSSNNAPTFDVLASQVPSLADRDLIAELLEDPRVNEPEDFRLTDDYTGILTFPKVTDDNVGRDTNGCIRSHYCKLDEATSMAIFANCKRHEVSFQALLSSVAVLAAVKLLKASNELDDAKWNATIVHNVPVNMRRYLQKPADNVSSCFSAGAIWKQPPLKNAEELSSRIFWSDFVKRDVHTPLQDCVASPFPIQYLHRLNSGKPVPPTSVVASSVGNITVLQRTYGDLQLDNVFLQAGFYAASQEAYEHPVVPATLINSGAPGFAMLHAYTVFDALHLTGSYYAYHDDYIRAYYDEVQRLLAAAGSERAQDAVLKVGDIFRL